MNGNEYDSFLQGTNYLKIRHETAYLSHNRTRIVGTLVLFDQLIRFLQKSNVIDKSKTSTDFTRSQTIFLAMANSIRGILVESSIMCQIPWWQS